MWLPDWPIQRRIVARPELDGQAVVLYGREARRGERVRACSPAAWQRGIRPGMPRADAAVLAPAASAAIHFMAHDPYQDRLALQELALACGRFSPLVGLNPTEPPDGLQLDITGVATLFGGEAALLEQVAIFFRQRGYRVRLAIAPTCAAASAVARWGSASTIVPPGDLSQLAALPVAALELEEGVRQQLRHLGIGRIGQLQGLSRGSLGARFGRSLLVRLDRLSGAMGQTVVACRPRPSWQVERVFEHALADRGVLEAVLRELSVRLSQQLQAGGRGIFQLEGRLVCQGGQVRTMQVVFFQPAVEPSHLAALLQMHFERLDFPEGVQRIELAAVVTAARDRRQGRLFADSSPGDAAELAQLIERLSNRLGRERVVRAELAADAQPERAYRCLPLTGVPSGESPAAGQPGRWGSLYRPLKLDSPQGIGVLGVAGEGPPAAFFLAGRRHRIARSFGPERIETGWWRGPSCRRDYYRVETVLGQRFWLFRRLPDQRWFLQGEFT